MSQTCFSQETEYQIIDSLKNAVIDYVEIEVYSIDKIEIKTVETGIAKRTILKVDSINIGKEINGRYIKEIGPRDDYGQSCYYIMKEDFRQFVKNELILKDSLGKYTNNVRGLAMYVGSDSKYLIKNVETGKLYYTTGDILNNWGRDYVVVELYSRIDKLNIKRRSIDDKIFLYLNGFQCVLTMDIAPALFKNDATCIKTMNESVNKYKECNKKNQDLAIKLSNHIKLYKSHLLKDDGLAAWKKDTKECDAILIKMRNLPYANSADYNQQLEEDLIKAHTAIIDLVLYSKGKLGI